MNVMQSLGVKAPSANTTAVREQSGAPESGSFRSTMERAEQNCNAAKPGQDKAEAAVKEDTDVSDAVKEIAEALEQTAMEDAAAAEGADGEESAMDELLSLLLGGDEEDESEIELVAGELAAAMVQPGAAVQDAGQPMTGEETALLMNTTVLEGQVKAADMTAEAPAVLEEMGAAEQQAAAPRMGEAAGMAAEQMTIENTLTEAKVEPTAMKADGQDAAAGQNLQDMAPEMGGSQAFSVANQPVVTADLTAPGGAPLPEPEMAGVLQDNIFDQIQTAVNTGKNEIFIQLKPENLGGLVIQLAMTEEGIKAQVRTTSENIQNLVNTQIYQLEETLRARDIPVVEMEVIFDQSANNNYLGQQRQAWQGRGGSSGGSRTMAAAIDETVGFYEAALAAAPDGIDGVESGREFSA